MYFHERNYLYCTDYCRNTKVGLWDGEGLNWSLWTSPVKQWEEHGSLYLYAMMSEVGRSCRWCPGGGLEGWVRGPMVRRTLDHALVSEEWGLVGQSNTTKTDPVWCITSTWRRSGCCLYLQGTQVSCNETCRQTSVVETYLFKIVNVWFLHPTLYTTDKFPRMQMRGLFLDY